MDANVFGGIARSAKWARLFRPKERAANGEHAQVLRCWGGGAGGAAAAAAAAATVDAFLPHTFGDMDADGSGTVSAEEFKLWFTATHRRRTDSDADKIFSKVDADGDGTLRVGGGEFASAIAKAEAEAGIGHEGAAAEAHTDSGSAFGTEGIMLNVEIPAAIWLCSCLTAYVVLFFFFPLSF